MPYLYLKIKLFFPVFADMEYERYKIVVQVVVGEQKGEGVKYVNNITFC